MEFWSRLIRGGDTSSKPSSNANNPKHRLAQFKRAYNNLLQLWRNGDALTDDAFVVENVRICLRRIFELQHEDQRSPTPHLCVTFCATSRVLVTITRIATAFGNRAITLEALDCCAALIDSEEEAFLEDRAFADALPELVESVERSAPGVGTTLAGFGDGDGDLSAEERAERSAAADLVSRMVEALFGVAAKLRSEPHVLLRVWFRPERPEEDAEYAELTDAERRTPFEEFPLLYALLRYVPAEGRTGEFARMGLLYLLEAARNSTELERWIVEGDMAALMASGLGALYSQLSRNLVLSYNDDETPSILTFSARLRADSTKSSERTTSRGYQTHLSTFLSTLVFWQDVLEKCPSRDIGQTLLDHFHYLFLQQLLYPSLLESSDIDGGSSVAVLTYLKHILESIDHPDLVRMTLQYLFGIHSLDTDAPRTPLNRARRRKSESLLARLAEQEDRPSPDLFNLSDLIMSSLQSESQQTVTAILSILSAILQRPHHQALTIVLRTRLAQSSDEKRTVGAHEKEVDDLLTLAEGLTAFQDLETSFEQHIYDMRNALESHPCSIQLLSLPAPNKKMVNKKSDTAPSPRIMNLEDPTLKSLLHLLDGFFGNDIETNLGLTQVFKDLASCGYMRLEGWMLTDPSVYLLPEQARSPSCSSLHGQDSEENGESSFTLSENRIRKIRLCRRAPDIPIRSASPIIRTLTRLVNTVTIFRRTIPEFDAHLHTCRITIEPTTPTPSPSIPAETNPSTPSRKSFEASRSPSRAPQSLGGAVLPPSGTTTPAKPFPIPTVRIRSDQSAASTPSLSGSPRGRQLPSNAEFSPLRLIQQQISPTRTALSEQAPRGLSSSPLREGAMKTAAAAAAAASRAGAPRTPPQLPMKRQRVRAEVPAALLRRVYISSGASAETPAESASSPAGGEQSGRGKGEHSRRGNRVEDDDDDREDGAAVTSDEDEGGKEYDSRKNNGATAPVGRNNGEADVTVDTADQAEDARARKKSDVVTLGHLLTNIIILQEFILEIAAAVEVRGTSLGEVKYL